MRASRSSHSRPRDARARGLLRVLVACGLAGCGQCGSDQDGEGSQPVSAAEPALQRQELAAPAPATADGSTPRIPASAPARPRYPRPGWSKVTVDDTVPICVFPGFEEHFAAKFLPDVKKQKLLENAKVVIGAFGPWCINEACDDLPSLQCSVKREGNALVVKTHYWGYHKDGATCTETCREVTAGCESPVLEAGLYTIQHGDQSHELKIPSVLRNPCFGAKK